MRTYLAMGVLTLVAWAGSSAPVQAAVVYSSLVTYRTGYDPYHPFSTDGDAGTNFESTGFAVGTTSSLLDYSGAGPLRGQFGFSGAAQAAAAALKVRATVTLTDYGIGSFNLVDMPAEVPDDFPQAGLAHTSVIDQTFIHGPASSYDVAFTYLLTGTASRPTAYESWFRSFLAGRTTFRQPDTGTTVGSGSWGFYPDASSYDTLLTVTANAVPSNTALELQQFLLVTLYAADSMYLGTSPCDDGGMLPPGSNPSSRPCVTGLVGEDPYSLVVNADFSHTLQLQSVAILDTSGAVAQGASLASMNGIRYPGQGLTVPAPATGLLLAAALGCMALQSRNNRRPPPRRAV